MHVKLPIELVQGQVLQLPLHDVPRMALVVHSNQVCASVVEEVHTAVPRDGPIRVLAHLLPRLQHSHARRIQRDDIQEWEHQGQVHAQLHRLIEPVITLTESSRVNALQALAQLWAQQQLQSVSQELTLQVGLELWSLHQPTPDAAGRA